MEPWETYRDLLAALASKAIPKEGLPAGAKAIVTQYRAQRDTAGEQHLRAWLLKQKAVTEFTPMATAGLEKTSRLLAVINAALATLDRPSA